MKIENPKQLLFGVVVGVVIGISGSLIALRTSNRDEYSVSVLNERTAIKINKRTGESWQFDRVNRVWAPIPQSK